MKSETQPISRSIDKDDIKSSQKKYDKKYLSFDNEFKKISIINNANITQ